MDSVSGMFAHADMPLTQTGDYTGDPGLCGPGSVSWRVIGDVSVFVGGIRALLIQSAHPEVAAGVDDHSRYRDDPLGRLRPDILLCHLGHLWSYARGGRGHRPGQIGPPRVSACRTEPGVQRFHPRVGRVGPQHPSPTPSWRPTSASAAASAPPTPTVSWLSRQRWGRCWAPRRCRPQQPGCGIGSRDTGSCRPVRAWWRPSGSCGPAHPAGAESGAIGCS